MDVIQLAIKACQLFLQTSCRFNVSPPYDVWGTGAWLRQLSGCLDSQRLLQASNSAELNRIVFPAIEFGHIRVQPRAPAHQDIDE